MRCLLSAATVLILLTLSTTAPVYGDCSNCLIGTTGDIDLDGDVDAGDWPLLSSCYGGPDVLVTGNCEFADLEHDGDIDLADLQAFQLAYSEDCNCPSNLLPPTARFTVSAHLGIYPHAVFIDASRTSDSEAIIRSYQWDFGDGTQGSGPQVIHTFTQPGEYTVILTASDAGGLIDTTEVVITVSDGLYDPSGFVTENEARRFLWQAGFGPDPNSVNFIVQNGYEAWIDAQALVPANRIRWEDQQANYDAEYGWTQPHEIWDDICVEGQDQLRQRMAWALIQIIVMNTEQAMSGDESGGYYYSEYIERALGNYRDLLEFVTFSHQMGFYLTYLDNQKEDPIAGTQPDENYARELAQLFTIGLVELSIYGTPLLDMNGQPIPTYGNDEIRQFARIFTGFQWNWELPDGVNRFLYPMRMEPDNHEFGDKQLLNYPGVIPSNGYIAPVPEPLWSQALALQDIQVALDNVFYHPNVAPFISKQLIQRLVTSNPTPDYVARVADAFEGNGPYGSGVRGDLLATAKAILLDVEARDPTYRTNPAYGRLIEPLITRWGLYRILGRADRPAETFPFRISSGPWNGMSNLGQQLLQSPSVFNFYPPDYIPPGTAMVDAGFRAPELRIHNDVTSLATVNTFRDEIIIPENEREAARYTDWRLLASDPNTLVEQLNQEIMYGTLTPEAHNIIVSAISQLADPTHRVKTAVWLMACSPEFRVLK
jgi:uncharacterized protein (DUF1800 family)